MAIRTLCVSLLIVAGSAVEAAAQYDMEGIELLSVVPLSQMGGGNGNDIWGWTDSLNGKEYALFGRTTGTSFVDVSDPEDPVYLGNLPTATSSSIWRDIKVYNDHAFVVADSAGPHGMQVFNLHNLRGVMTPQTFSADTTWDQFGFRSAHNIAINEDSGFAYIVGSDDAAGGLVMVDISNPTSPTLAGEFAGDGYSHDTQVVNYIGPDPDHAGQELAFSSNEDTLTITDVTNKTTPTLVSRAGYPMSGYSHQGWLSEDQHYFFLNDEFDEFGSPTGRTRTHVWNVEDLDSPDYRGFHEGTVAATDHNLYVKGNLIYEANYSSGLRVLDITDPANADLTEIAYLDTNPQNSGVGFDGAWSVFPYFDSGTIIVSDQDNGLFVARLVGDPNFNGDNEIDCADVNLLTAEIAAGTNNLDFDLTFDGSVNGEDLTEWLALAGEANLPNGNPYLPADATLDGVVDGQDFIAWNDHKFTDDTAFCNGNFNADDVIDGLDFIIWNEHKFTSSDVVAVPEPAALSLVLVSVLFIRARRLSGGLSC